jgi:hypothetical protein
MTAALAIYAVLVSAWAVFQQSVLTERDALLSSAEEETEDLKASLQRWIFKARDARLLHEACSDEVGQMRPSFLKLQAKVYRTQSMMSCKPTQEYEHLFGPAPKGPKQSHEFNGPPALNLLKAVQELDIVSERAARALLLVSVH